MKKPRGYQLPGGVLVPFFGDSGPKSSPLLDALRRGTKTKTIIDLPSGGPREAAGGGVLPAVKISKPIKPPRFTKEQRNAHKLEPGQKLNPLKAFPKNAPCFCGSQRKAKKCCIPRQSWAVSEGAAQKVTAGWARLVAGEATLQTVILEQCQKKTLAF